MKTDICPACDEVLYASDDGYVTSESYDHLLSHGLGWQRNCGFGRCPICRCSESGGPILAHLKGHAEAEIALYLLGRVK